MIRTVSVFMIREVVISTEHQPWRLIRGSKYAIDLQDTKLLSKLAGGDMVAIDAVYHSKCLVSFYNRAREKYSTETVDVQSASRLHATAFAEIVWG